MRGVLHPRITAQVGQRSWSQPYTCACWICALTQTSSQCFCVSPRRLPSGRESHFVWAGSMVPPCVCAGGWLRGFQKATIMVSGNVVRIEEKKAAGAGGGAARGMSCHCSHSAMQALLFLFQHCSAMPCSAVLCSTVQCRAVHFGYLQHCSGGAAV